VAAAILLLPTLFARMVSPMAVRAAADRHIWHKRRKPLRSTIGSVAGSVAVSLILIPHFVFIRLLRQRHRTWSVPVCYPATRQRQVTCRALAVALAVSTIFTKVSGESADREIYYKGDPHPSLQGSIGLRRPRQ
jgi:hypothetical protein